MYVGQGIGTFVTLIGVFPEKKKTKKIFQRSVTSVTSVTSGSRPLISLGKIKLEFVTFVTFVTVLRPRQDFCLYTGCGNKYELLV